MSVIPRIKIGTPSKRRSFPANFDCSTTANLGSVQPTMCREMPPKTTFSVKTNSLIRLASMPVPTFGRVTLKNYHCFVPYSSLYEPYTAMLSAQPFVSSGNSFVPTQVPTFMMSTLRDVILKFSDFSFAKTDDLDDIVKIEGSTIEELTASMYAARDIVRSLHFNGQTQEGMKYIFNSHEQLNQVFGNMTNSSPADSEADGVLRFGDFSFVPGSASTQKPATAAAWAFADVTESGEIVSSANRVFATPNLGVITPESADLIFKVSDTDYSCLVKFKPCAKRLRQVMIGLGYQFNPWDSESDFPLLKVFAYYKAYFELFNPVREIAFTSTNCYKLMKHLSQIDGINVSLDANQNPLLFLVFSDIAKYCYYYLPQDYYSMGTVSPVNAQNNFVVGSDSGNLLIDSPFNEKVVVDPLDESYQFTNESPDNPVMVRLAERVMRFANKNTVVGRSIRDYIKAHFGVYEDQAADSSQVVRIGASRVQIKISDIMSTAESENGYLGEYGGRGLGFGDSPKFSYTAKEFGVWLTLTVVVPESGYYQGVLRENMHKTRFDFYHEEFDAVGYQVLSRGEVMADFNCDGPSFKPASDYCKLGFSFVPRYSEYKVGRNIVNGDLSLIGLYNSMAPYFLDRRFPSGQLAYRKVSVDGRTFGRQIVAPTYLPEIVSDAFRRIDPSDHIGQYNRMFNYGGNDLDHFIIHQLFDVKVTSVMVPLTTSFDTFNNGDDSSIEVTHS